mmetsp:Transcript_38674/g.28024  ORF Transcript_38674/g.28024 Transcript_38674/m.28024 type:complete len:360 (-) Transcript_38674:240-1319(-)|eukprot:CAMPEP_0116876356 /NCGR_PEP_ID=MMETSP0463-20121206/8312_1 /TAXON_ID=181622 /ORGANISM="Strombidinopsis sp, Strain SopsisLIS2011" /LENGTH=359 /DNA_ID=CAMNT_0004522907 /DNA_START=24 /DNA_END=1103 /DNA_ORIENTATION=-
MATTRYVLLAALIQSVFAEDGYWTGHDFQDSWNSIAVANGMVLGTNDSMQRRLVSAMMIGDDNSPYINTSDWCAGGNPENLCRINRVFNTEAFPFLFGMADSIYSYEKLMEAFARYPKFCNEADVNFELNADDACRNELSVLYTYICDYTGAYETASTTQIWRQCLYINTEAACTPYNASDSSCYYNVTTGVQGEWTPEEYEQYYGRGAVQMKYNYYYGPFSLAATGNATRFLSDPDELQDDGFYAFLSALYFYMTPHNPAPSLHEIATGYWLPNDNDMANNITVGFGATINAISPEECGGGYNTEEADLKIEYYSAFAEFYHRQAQMVNMDCANMLPFENGGTFTGPQHWVSNPNNIN